MKALEPGAQEATVVRGGSDTVTLNVTTTEAQSLSPIGPALEGVRLCEADTTNCATTGSDGMASIELSADEEVSYTLEKEGYAPYLVADVTDDALFQNGPWAMYSDALIEELLGELGVASPMGGQLILRAVSGSVIEGIAGITFELVDETAAPFYNEQLDAVLRPNRHNVHRSGWLRRASHWRVSGRVRRDRGELQRSDRLAG